jgi:hypothetical protein
MADGSRSRVWLPATAAGIALLVSGIVALTHHGPGLQRNDPNPTVVELAVDSTQVTAEVDRCWDAAQRLAKEARFPDRSEWRPVLSITAGGLSSVTAIQTNSRPLFCETTNSSVTLSNPSADPAYAPDTKTAAMLTTVNGTVAGVADPSWPDMRVAVTSKYRGDVTGTAIRQAGLFIFQSFTSTVDGNVRASAEAGAPELVLPKPAAPFGTVDPGYPPGDRSSSHGVQLGRCVEEAKSVGPDAETWNPGAVVEANGQRLIMAANPGGVSACLQRGQQAELMPYISRTTLVTAPQLLSVVPTVGGRALLAGLIPPGVARMQLTFADHTTMTADVAESTFAVLMPPDVSAPKNLTCTLLGASGQILYTGPVS